MAGLGKGAALLIVGLLPVLSGVIPVLDIWPEDTRTGIQDHRHPGTHGLPHNHLICIQQAANHWAPDASAPSLPCFRRLLTGREHQAPRAIDLERPLPSPKPRSPPSL